MDIRDKYGVVQVGCDARRAVKLRPCSDSWSVQVDVTDVTKTAEAFLKIASVYKEENNEVKNAVLESIGETL